MEYGKKDRLRPYLVAMLLAVEVMLSFSSFGYITLGSFTLSFIPISIYAVAFLFGAKWSMLAGLIFGLSSMWMATVGAGTSLDYLYAPARSGNPAASIVLALGSRILLGLVAGITLQKVRNSPKCCSRRVAAVTVLNQILYTAVSLLMGVVLFPTLDIAALNIEKYGVYLIVNLIIECTAFSAAAVALFRILKLSKVQTVLEYCHLGVDKISQKLTFIYVFSLLMFFSIFSAGAFGQYVSMSRRALEAAAVSMDRDILLLLLQLVLQQMLSNIAIFVIMISFVMMAYFYFIERRDKLAYRADRDMMTGLYNRETAKEKIRDYRETHKGVPCTFLMIDIDGLKIINDTLGHEAGDKAIIGVSNALITNFSQPDIIGRMGGDEFIVFLGGVASEEHLSPILERLQKAISQVSIADDGRELRVSIGVRLDPEGKLELDDLYRSADSALYRAKNQGKNKFLYYEREDG